MTNHKRIKVLYLTNNPNLQSTALPMEGWINNLSDKFFIPIIVTISEGTLHTWAKQNEIPVYILNLDHPDKFQPLKLLIQLFKLAYIAIIYRINIIHCNEQNIFPIGNLISRILIIPNVVSIHFSMNKEFCLWAFKNKSQLRKVFFTSEANKVICLPNISGIVEQKYLAVLKNGINLEQYSFNQNLKDQFLKSEKITNKFIVGVACALRPRKQVEHLIQAVAKIKSKDIIILIAGNYLPEDFEYGNKLIQEAKYLLGDQIRFLGHLDDLVGFYSTLDLFVNTSIEEACSLSVLQALACSCPVVGYSSKDTVSEQILPGGGEIVPQDDIEALSNVITKYMRDTTLREESRIGARKRVEEDYDSIKQSRILMNVYQEILSDKS